MVFYKNYILIGVLVVLCSCSNNTLFETPKVNQSNKSFSVNQILVFSNKNAFDEAYKKNEFTPPNRTFNDSILNGGHFIQRRLRSNGTNEIKKISLEELVPDKRLANMLNSKGEIIISDTLYKITKDGTFYTPVSNKDALEYYSSHMGMVEEKPLKNDKYVYNNVYRFDTYKNVDFNDNKNAVAIDKIDGGSGGSGPFPGDHSNSNSHSNVKREMLQDIDVADFIEVNPHPENFISRLWAHFGGRISNIYQLSSNVRLNAEVYSYDNVFVHSIGITAKVQKLMWYGGWAMLKYWQQDCLRIGFKNVFIYKDFKKDLSKIPGIKHIPFTPNSDDDLDVYSKCFQLVYGNQFGDTPRADLFTNPISYGGMFSYSAYPVCCVTYGSKLYTFYPNYWGKNATDNTEIEFRFDWGLNPIIIGINNLSPYTLTPNNNPDLIHFIKDNLIIKTNSQDNARLQRGVFYAAVKFNGEWKGLKMNW